MPHRRNPAASETVAATAIPNLGHEHERFKIGLQVEREFMPRLFCHTDAAIKKAVFVVKT